MDNDKFTTVKALILSSWLIAKQSESNKGLAELLSKITDLTNKQLKKINFPVELTESQVMTILASLVTIAALYALAEFEKMPEEKQERWSNALMKFVPQPEPADKSKLY